MDQLRPAKKGQLTNYCLFIASRWFETIEDFINVEKGCKRFLGNTTKFFYNPIPLTEQTRKQLVKELKTNSENNKVAIRNIRRDIIDQLRKFEKEKI